MVDMFIRLSDLDREDKCCEMEGGGKTAFFLLGGMSLVDIHIINLTNFLGFYVAINGMVHSSILMIT